MNFFRDQSGWTLVFAILVSAVVCDAFGIRMGLLRRIEIRRRAAGPSALVGEGEHWATNVCRVAVRSSHILMRP